VRPNDEHLFAVMMNTNDSQEKNDKSPDRNDATPFPNDFLSYPRTFLSFPLLPLLFRPLLAASKNGRFVKSF
ncbi:MAG: hypothetical protein ACI3YC_07200, partial [Alloprevotella sp.]